MKRRGNIKLKLSHKNTNHKNYISHELKEEVKKKRMKKGTVSNSLSIWFKVCMSSAFSQHSFLLFRINFLDDYIYNYSIEFFRILLSSERKHLNPFIY